MLILRGIKLTTALAAFAMFFMPWLDVQCSNKSLLTQTGVQTITGQATPSKEMEPRKGEGSRESLGAADFVGAALLATALAIACLLVALLNGQMKMDLAGGVLSALALLCLLVQLSQGFPIKEEIITRISTDQATNEADLGSFLAQTMMNDMEVLILPGFTYTCVLLGVVVLLTLGQFFAKLGVARSGAASLLLAMCLVGCERADKDVNIRDESSWMESDLSHMNALYKYESIVIPQVVFEDTTIEDAVEFLRLRALELDTAELDPAKKGVGFVIRGPQEQRNRPADPSLEAAIGSLESVEAEYAKNQSLITFKAENIKFIDALLECAKQVGMDLYLTSHGMRMVPEGEKPEGVSKSGRCITRPRSEGRVISPR